MLSKRQYLILVETSGFLIGPIVLAERAIHCLSCGLNISGKSKINKISAR